MSDDTPNPDPPCYLCGRGRGHTCDPYRRRFPPDPGDKLMNAGCAWAATIVMVAVALGLGFKILTLCGVINGG